MVLGGNYMNPYSNVGTENKANQSPKKSPTSQPFFKCEEDIIVSITPGHTKIGISLVYQKGYTFFMHMN